MNRRSFLRSLGVAVTVACAAPAILRGQIERAVTEPQRDIREINDAFALQAHIWQQEIYRHIWRTNPFVQLLK